jgi:hypothetical protein
MFQVALCSFDETVGWRVVGYSKSNTKKIAVFEFGGIKLLKMPTDVVLRGGSFCNPAKFL